MGWAWGLLYHSNFDFHHKRFLKEVEMAKAAIAYPESMLSFSITNWTPILLGRQWTCPDKLLMIFFFSVSLVDVGDQRKADRSHWVWLTRKLFQDTGSAGRWACYPYLFLFLQPVTTPEEGTGRVILHHKQPEGQNVWCFERWRQKIKGTWTLDDCGAATTVLECIPLLFNRENFFLL